MDTALLTEVFDYAKGANYQKYYNNVPSLGMAYLKEQEPLMRIADMQACVVRAIKRWHLGIWTLQAELDEAIDWQKSLHDLKEKNNETS